ncbi:MAG: hypothetical protein U0559_05010 [Anaerolineae bacterium]
MFTSKMWRVIACGAIGLVAVAAVLSIGQANVQADKAWRCARRQRRRQRCSTSA